MDIKVLHRSFATLAFLVATATYLLTIQPTVPFWDCGEFTAAAIQQQVPHPPGAPLFLMVGKVFEVLVPFGDPGWKVNLVSVFSSSISVLLLYLITVMVINNFREKAVEEFSEALAVYGASLVAALTFTFTDTFWFNAVESEVYAASSLFVAIIIFLMMRWNEEAEKPGHERYLLLIAYLIGLSTGVHLLSVLTVFSIVLLVYFRKYEFTLKGFLIAGAIAVVIFFGIYPGIVKWVPALLDGHSFWKTEAGEWAIVDSTFLRVLIIGILIAASYFLWKEYNSKRGVLGLICAAFLLMIVGYSSYTHILLRANAHPPMNENNPDNLTKLVSYLGREQYGSAPTFMPRRHDTRRHVKRRFFDYGEYFEPEYKTVQREDGTRLKVPDYANSQMNYAGEFRYLIEYQMNHMYWRYFLWNFVGRTSDVQDAPATDLSPEEEVEWFNYDSGFGHLYPISFYGLPLLIGLLGLFYHFVRNQKMAGVYVVMFLLMGVLAALQQNQQNPQPRERDYFYVGSFMVWCMWIGIGVFFMVENYLKKAGTIPITAMVLIASIALVPVNMAYQGWATHDRSGNYFAFDYAYNILQSVEQDAIVFTNGDNDTFPVWYLQDVAGVRRDVRIANLSLGNTLWYVDQLKNETPWGAPKIPLSFSDESIQTADENSPVALSYFFDGAIPVNIPVSNAILSQYTSDPAILADGHMRFTWTGDPYDQRDGQQIYVFRVQDQLVKDILEQTKFERPVYYSMSVGPDAYCGLEPFFRLEGMALRICPVVQNSGGGYFNVNEEVMDATALNIIPGDEYHTEFQYGWKLRNLNNPDVFYDESNRRPVPSFRNIYMNYATWLMRNERHDKAVAVLDTLNHYISPDMFPMPFPQELQLSEIYQRSGAESRAREYAERAVASATRLIENPLLTGRDPFARSYDPYKVAADAYHLIGEYDQSIAIWERFVSDKGKQADPSVQALIDQLKIEKFETQGDYLQALKMAEQTRDSYLKSGQSFLNGMVPSLERKIVDLKTRAGIAIDDTVSGESDN